ncbi:MAG: DUF3299 domain-containing protein, partial [Alphaproteobacteria bacterium]|nr:DUF3299 domain-containing protein [Alphaproteobacteria bacterium]
MNRSLPTRWPVASFAAMLFAAIFFTLAGGGTANAERVIKWEDLLPQAAPPVDPFGALTQDQRFDIETVIWARGMSDAERAQEYNRQPLEDAQKYERQFKAAGIDVDQILKDYLVWQQEMSKREKLVNDALNGEAVKLAGYLLPLEFSETGEKNFLLVPYVGACVHVPPPPANQIVFVSLAEKMVVKDLYTPVWIKGQVQTKRSSRAL